MAPIITWTVIKKLIIDPVVKEWTEREKEKQRELNKSRMMEKQREAKAATELMKETVSRIRTEEESKKGLIITKALYGRFVYPQDRDITEESGHRDEMIDVTIPLQCLVKDSKLILHKASKVCSYKLVSYVKSLIRLNLISFLLEISLLSYFLQSHIFNFIQMTLYIMSIKWITITSFHAKLFFNSNQFLIN